MDKHYNIDEARDALEKCALLCAGRESVQLAAVNRDSSVISNFDVVRFEKPTTWRIIQNMSGVDEEVVWTIQGIIHQKNLPPVVEKPRAARRGGYLRQNIALVGLGSPTFDSAVKSTQNIYNMFERHFVEGKLNPLALDDSSYTEMKALDVSNRYLTPRKDAPDAEPISISPLVDPHGILEQLSEAGFIHTEDNEVLYFMTKDNEKGEKTFSPVAPQAFRVGDIVEVQASFVVVPLKGGKHKMMCVLRSVALLDGKYTEEARLRKQQETKDKSTVPKETLKRRVGYKTTEEPSGHIINNSPLGESEGDMVVDRG